MKMQIKAKNIFRTINFIVCLSMAGLVGAELITDIIGGQIFAAIIFGFSIKGLCDVYNSVDKFICKKISIE